MAFNQPYDQDDFQIEDGYTADKEEDDNTFHAPHVPTNILRRRFIKEPHLKPLYGTFPLHSDDEYDADEGEPTASMSFKRTRRRGQSNIPFVSTPAPTAQVAIHSTHFDEGSIAEIPQANIAGFIERSPVVNFTLPDNDPLVFE